MWEKYLVVYSAEARRDLKRIKDYITKILLAPQAASNQTKRIRDSIRDLEFMPERFVVVEWEPWQSLWVRKMAVDKSKAF